MDRAQWKILLSAWVLSADHCHFIPAARQASGNICLGDSGAYSPSLAPRSHMLNHHSEGTEQVPDATAALCRRCSRYAVTQHKL